jgi:recombination protein RecT
MEGKNLPATQRAADIRGLLERSKKQLEMALPKHLTADRLLRVAMTSIQRTPKLLECTPQSLLACVMTCAQLGLEPDQFLGQAYLVPFRDTKKNIMICTLIPGYRGYIALARRSGEVQSVSAQVVYEKDEFELSYGIEDKLVHRPHINGDRGEPIGAFVVFKFKDGGYSFDFMSTEDIEKVRKRSKAASDGPWVTDWAEMAKKTVIKRHAKLAPLSVEFQKAAALEERAMTGESQADILDMGGDPNVIDAESGPSTTSPAELIAVFDESIPKGSDLALVEVFLAKVAEGNKKTIEEIKIAAASDPKELASLWKLFPAWCKQRKASEKKKKDVDALTGQDLAPLPCPNREDHAIMPVAFCEKCTEREGCPAWPEGT